MGGDLEVLRRAVAAAEAQLSTLRFELGGVSNECVAIQEELEQRSDEELAQQLQATSAGTAPRRGSFASLSIGSREGDEGDVLADIDPKERAEVLAGLRAAAVDKLGLDGMKEELHVSQALLGLSINKPRARGAGRTWLAPGPSENVHPFRVTVFAGSSATLSCTVNVDERSTFAAVLHFVCAYWELDEGEVRLQANLARTSTEFVPHEFAGSALVIDELEELKYRAERGHGVNGVTNSPFKTQQFVLAPLYLVARESESTERGSGDGADPAQHQKPGEESLARREQFLRRLFMAQARIFPPGIEQGLIDFEQMTRVAHDFFEGFYFDRTTMKVLFEEKARLVSLDTQHLAEPVVDLARCAEIIGLLQIKLDKAQRNRFLLEGDCAPQTATTATAPAAAVAGQQDDGSDAVASVAAARIFAWMTAPELHEQQEPDQAELQRVRRGSAADLTRSLLHLDMFQHALRSALPVDTRTLNAWWNNYLGGPDDAITVDEFITGWAQIEGLTLSGIGLEPIKVGDAVRRAVLRFEQRYDMAREGRVDRRWRLLFYRRLSGVLFALAGVLLAMAILFVNFSPRNHGVLRQAYTSQAVDAPLFCLDLDRIAVGGGLFDSDGATPQVSTFGKINAAGCLYGFLLGPLREMFFEGFFSGTVTEDTFRDVGWTLLAYNTLGPVSVNVRQLRVKNTTCVREHHSSKAATTTAADVRECLPEYSRETENRDAIPLVNRSGLLGGRQPQDYAAAFEFSDNADLVNLDEVEGHFATYGIGGYQFSLGDIDVPPLGLGPPSFDNVTREAYQRWGVDVINLLKMDWLAAPTRAVIISLASLNRNVELYTNAEFLVEFSNRGEWTSSFQVRSFSPDTSDTSGFATAVVLRWLLLLLVVSNLVLETVLAISSEMAGAEAQSDEEARSSPASAAAASAAPKRRKLRQRVAKGFRAIFGSYSLMLTVLYVAWALVTIVVASDYSFEEPLEALRTVLPRRAWNGIALYAKYIRVVRFDAVMLVLLAAKLLSCLFLLRSTTVYLGVLRAAAPYLAVLGAVLFAATSALALGTYLVTEGRLGLTPLEGFNHFLHASFGTAISASFWRNQASWGGAQAAYLMWILHSFAVVLVAFPVVLAAYFYFYTFQYHRFAVVARDGGKLAAGLGGVTEVAAEVAGETSNLIRQSQRILQRAVSAPRELELSPVAPETAAASARTTPR